MNRPGSILKNAIPLGILLASLFFSPTSIASEKKWIDTRKNMKIEYFIKKDKGNGSSIYLTVKASELQHEKWILHDFIKSCTEDPVLEIIDKSIDYDESFDDKKKLYSFAYRMGCVGGVEPLNIKYFSFIGKQKYSLRGEETIFCDGTKYGGEEPPQADAYLKKNPRLYKLMLKKWNTFSTRKCGV